MKKWVCLFVVFITLGFGNSFANSEHIHIARQFSTLNKIKKVFKKTVFLNKKAVDSDSSDGAPNVHKKNNRKALKRMPHGIATESFSKINCVNDRSILFTDISYYFHTFPGNGKRGPPTTSYIS